MQSDLRYTCMQASIAPLKNDNLSYPAQNSTLSVSAFST